MTRENYEELNTSQNEMRRHYQTPWTAIFIPLIQSAVTGILICLTFLTLWAVVENVQNKASVGLSVLFSVMTITWFTLLRQWSRLAWGIEQAIGQDITGDGIVGEPELEPEPSAATIHLEIKHRDTGRIQFMDLPMSKLQFHRLFTGLANGLPFSENVWSGAGKPFSRDEFRGIRDIFLAKKWLRYKNEKATNMGFEITTEGWSIIRSACASVGETPGNRGLEPLRRPN